MNSINAYEWGHNISTMKFIYADCGHLYEKNYFRLLAEIS